MEGNPSEAEKTHWFLQHLQDEYDWQFTSGEDQADVLLFYYLDLGPCEEVRVVLPDSGKVARGCLTLNRLTVEVYTNVPPPPFKLPSKKTQCGLCLPVIRGPPQPFQL